MQLYSKETFSCEYGKIFKNTYFEKHLQMAASGMSLLLDIYHLDILSCSFPESVIVLVGKNRQRPEAYLKSSQT